MSVIAQLPVAMAVLNGATLAGTRVLEGEREVWARGGPQGRGFERRERARETKRGETE